MSSSPEKAKKYREEHIEERKLYDRARYIKNKEKYKNNSREWKRANKLRYRELGKSKHNTNKIRSIEYLGGKCIDCSGLFPPAIYDFHHVDPAIKDKRSAWIMNWSWERIKIELDKCVLLCSNCHRIRHHYKEIESIDIQK